MDHNQQPLLAGHAQDHETFLFAGIEPRNGDREWVAERGARLRETDPMFPAVRQFLLRIPLEDKSLHVPSSLADLEPT